jgi:hypothetical protein
LVGFYLTKFSSKALKNKARMLTYAVIKVFPFDGGE